MLVGDTGIEPVTSSVSGINTVLNNSPLSTKTVRERPVISTNIRGRCHAISHNTVQLELQRCSLLACPVLVGGSPRRIGGCRIWCRWVC